MPSTLNNRALGEFLGFTVFAIALKAVLDPVTWRYAAPISLIIVLISLSLYLKHQETGLKRLGIVAFERAKSYWLLPVQTVIAIVVIISTGVAVALLGDLSGLIDMQSHADGGEARFGNLTGNTSLFLFWLAIIWIAGPAEELFFRGFMINTLGELLGKSTISIALSVFIPALIFGAVHMYYQGLLGLFTTGFIGVSLGCLFLAYRRNIWPLMIAHACVNSLGFTLQYLGIDA